MNDTLTARDRMRNTLKAFVTRIQNVQGTSAMRHYAELMVYRLREAGLLDTNTDFTRQTEPILYHFDDMRFSPRAGVESCIDHFTRKGLVPGMDPLHDYASRAMGDDDQTFTVPVTIQVTCANRDDARDLISDALDRIDYLEVTSID